MKKMVIVLVSIITMFTLTGCSGEAPMPSLSPNGVENIEMEHIETETVIYETILEETVLEEIVLEETVLN